MAKKKTLTHPACTDQVDGRPIPLTKKQWKDIDVVHAYTASMAATKNNDLEALLSIVCAGCDGKKVQTRKDDGIKILCPVCAGSGLMPQAPLQPYPSQPYPWQPSVGGMLPNFPSQIID